MPPGPQLRCAFVHAFRPTNTNYYRSCLAAHGRVFLHLSMPSGPRTTFIAVHASGPTFALVICSCLSAHEHVFISVHAPRAHEHAFLFVNAFRPTNKIFQLLERYIFAYLKFYFRYEFRVGLNYRASFDSYLICVTSLLFASSSVLRIQIFRHAYTKLPPHLSGPPRAPAPIALPASSRGTTGR